jgi:hypothetical protein
VNFIKAMRNYEKWPGGHLRLVPAGAALKHHMRLRSRAALSYGLPVKMAGRIAQLVEQRTENPCVPGSIPGPATTSIIRKICSSVGRL